MIIQRQPAQGFDALDAVRQGVAVQGQALDGGHQVSIFMEPGCQGRHQTQPIGQPSATVRLMPGRQPEAHVHATRR